MLVLSLKVPMGRVRLRISRKPRSMGLVAVTLKEAEILSSARKSTSKELSPLTSQFAQMLERRGIRSGDRVAIMLNPSLEYY